MEKVDKVEKIEKIAEIKDGVYYGTSGVPEHKGVVEFEGKLYYAGKNGVIVKDKRKTIHHGMANGLTRHGSYYFDADGVCDKESFQETQKSSHKSKKQSKQRKNEDIIKKALAIAGIVFAIICVILLISRCSDKNANTDSNAKSAGLIEVVRPDADGDVYLCTKEMKKFYQGKATLQKVVESGASAYKPFIFRYTLTNADSGTLKLSENVDLSNAVEYQLDPNSTRLEIDNLKTNTKYYYLATAESSKGEMKSDSTHGSFKTADTNRFIYLDGIINTRDIGGYDTKYDSKVKQGLLIRGTEMDGLCESSYYLKDLEGAAKFGFVCDFDLRSSSIFNSSYVSILGENVKHKFYNSPQYGGIFASGNEGLLREIFSDLADPSNYPMYLHCTYGADRTGTVVFLLQGLLGVSEEDMMTEYELTGFVNKSYADGSNLNSVLSGLQGCPGNTINEKIEYYMLNTVGLSSGQIQSLRDIFLN